MSKVPVYNAKGNVVSELALSDKVFAVKSVPTLVHQVILAEEVNARHSIAHTKTKGEVRGGGKKPWKQKHTGRARQGSIRAPQWKGGGVVFGPRSDRNYSVRINKKMKRKSLLMALSDRATNERLVVLDNLDVSGKTKDWRSTMKAVWSAVTKSTKSPKTLVVVPTISVSLKRATANMTGIEVVRADSLSTRMVVAHPYTLTTVAGVEAMQDWLTKK